MTIFNFKDFEVATMNFLDRSSTKKWILWLFIAVFVTGLSGCNVLEVDNPNNLGEEGLGNPAAVPSMVNGSEATVTRAIGAYLAPYSTTTDELEWVGSRDAWGRLGAGELDDPLNEFSDLAYTYMSEARWWSDEVISRIETFREAGELRSGDEVQLARAYLYGAIMYVTIADMFDDFVFSDRREASPPIGPDNMVNLYDDAISYIDNGLAISGISQELEATLTALRARANYSKALWGKLNPVNTTDPLVSNSAAASDAADALALMSTADFRHQLVFSPEASNLVVGDLSMALQVNSRLEMRVADEYAIPNEEGNQIAKIDDGNAATSISLNDPIDDIPDPVLHDRLVDFTTAEQYADITVVSAREMHLILAEDALANGNSQEFENHINDLRALNSELSSYDYTDSGQPDELTVLKHSRRVNLFFQGRRLADHYRFDEHSTYWEGTSPAASNPGTFFPIAITEIRANPNLNP
jgi:hypothetical protein